MAALTAAKAFGCQLQKLGNRLDVPVCVVDIDMPEICGELRQFLSYIEVTTVPFNEPSRRKAVTKVLKSRAMATAPFSRRRSQADVA
jgi:hypothetical protein